MRAIVFDRYGSPDVLCLKEIDTPVPKNDQVLVKIRAVRGPRERNGRRSESLAK
jgi:NADPH:quinone reductase-like Zn-dependent oxidoreductase